MDNNQLSTRPEQSGMARIKNYLLSDEVKGRFADMMGSDALYYLNQVLIVVANSDALQRCEPASILISAMRAASLKLSVDPAQGQAWIIPYKNKATFQLGYRGVYELAQRTGLYTIINDFKVYEGEQIVEDRITGKWELTGARKGNKVIAFGLYFRLQNGFEKLFWMTTEEIEAHAERYAQSYRDPRSKWNDPTERPKMMRKTVLSNGLRKWGRFCPGDVNILNQIEESDPAGAMLDIPDEAEVTPPPVQAPRPASDIMAELGFEPEQKPAPVAELYTDAQRAEAAAIMGERGKALGEIGADNWQLIYETYSQKTALTEKQSQTLRGCKVLLGLPQ